GMYPRNHGVWSNGVLAKDEGKTLPHYLRRQGYQTANVGKMHFEPTGDPTGTMSAEAKVHWQRQADHEIEQGYWGFDTIKCTIGHSVVTGNYRQWFLEHGGSDNMFQVDASGAHTGPMHMPETLHCTSYVGEMAVDYIQEQRDKARPFFLTVSFPDPHFPFTPPSESIQNREVHRPIGDERDLETRPERYRQHYEGCWSRSGLSGVSTPDGINEQLTKERIAYTYDMVELIDKNVGEVVAALKQEGIYEETIIVFLSDHGELLGDHGLWFKGPFLYEGLVNAPFILVDQQSRGQVSEALVSTLDLMPTLCDAVEVPVPHYNDGVSLLDSSKQRRQCLVEYRNGFGDQDFCVYALINKNYKFIRYEDGTYELNDLEKDKEERQNVASQPEYQDVVQQMTNNLLSYLMQTSTNRFPQICGN
ncbi:MAG: sulfatase-like hydrolase/transferase, partial [Niameybacter sp.]